MSAKKVLCPAQSTFMCRIWKKIWANWTKSQTIVTYCGSGYRASIAASLLKQNGFEKVVNVPGSWNAWTEADLPVEKPKADS